MVVCVSRLVPRKGQDTLIQAMPRILAAVPDAVLLIVGGGPYEKDLRQLAARDRASRDSVRFTGACPWAELPAHYGAGDVFAMPCRTRRGGLDVEGLGIVYLEASATGLPVVAGDSGGAPDAVLDGETGWVVRGGSPRSAADRIIALLGDPELRRAHGRAGPAWVEEKWRWDLLAETAEGAAVGRAASAWRVAAWRGVAARPVLGGRDCRPAAVPRAPRRRDVRRTGPADRRGPDAPGACRPVRP